MTKPSITFSDAECESSSSCWQDIFFDGKEVGALNSRYHGLLKPSVERFQCCRKEEPYLKDYKTYTTEDEGYVFVCFDNVEDFTEFVLKHPEKDLK